MTLAIGVIADDVTGGTDVAVSLRRAGLRTVILFGQPEPETQLPPHDAAVVALKTRMLEPGAAVSQSLAALAWLQSRAAEHIYFKYCSTFDSTPRGNIGPVLDALSEALGETTVVTTPSSPEHGRTQYRGYLFVGDALLSDSPMRDHPVTPMRDSSLPRLLAPQARGSIAVVGLEQVREGSAELARTLDAIEARYVFVDAIEPSDLAVIGEVALRYRLSSGAAGLAGGLAAALAPRRTDRETDMPPVPTGRAVVLAGSCSARTLEQVDNFVRAGRPAYRLDPLEDQDAHSLAATALAWFDSLADPAAALIYSSADPARLAEIEARLGLARAASVLETAIGIVAEGVVRRGVRRIIAAGGETSGSIVAALGVAGGLIGSEAARGVPWIHTESGLALLLKSGNFGSADLLLEASA